MNNNEELIDMSDALILDYGAKLVATTAALCDNLQTIKLQQCRITDTGAIELFRELKDHQSLKLIDVSYNPITEKCFDALCELLSEND
jgi:Ran GTPase-activating protein (RanGAP) involved in mRNA processing and transport